VAQTRAEQNPGPPEPVVTAAAAPLGAPPARDGARPPAPVRQAVLNIRTVQEKGLTWIDIQRPGRAEIDWLRSHYRFHPLHLEDITSKIQRPKLDEREDYIFLVLHWPIYNKITRVTTASEVDIFIGKSFLITVHAGHLRPLLRYFQQCLDDEEIRTRAFRRSSGYLLYRIIDKLVDYCFPSLGKIDQNIEIVEDMIFEQDNRQSVYELSVIRRDIIAYRRIIKPQIAVLGSLERRAHSLQPLLGDDLGEYFSDLSDHLSKIWDTLEDYKEVVDGLTGTNDSLTATRITDVIKMLTVLTAVLLPLSLLLGVYGLVPGLSAEAHAYGFLVGIGVVVLALAGMLAFFRYRHWI